MARQGVWLGKRCEQDDENSARGSAILTIDRTKRDIKGQIHSAARERLPPEVYAGPVEDAERRTEPQ